MGNFNELLPCNGTASYTSSGTYSRIIPAVVVEQHTETKVEHESVEDKLYDKCGDDVLTYTLDGTLGKEQCDYGCACGSSTQTFCDTGYSLGSNSQKGNTNLNDQNCQACAQYPDEAMNVNCDPSECGGIDAVVTLTFDDMTTDDPSAEIEERVYAAIEDSINEVISDALNYAIQESLKGLIHI